MRSELRLLALMIAIVLARFSQPQRNDHGNSKRRNWRAFTGRICRAQNTRPDYGHRAVWTSQGHTAKICLAGNIGCRSGPSFNRAEPQTRRSSTSRLSNSLSRLCPAKAGGALERILRTRPAFGQRQERRPCFFTELLNLPWISTRMGLGDAATRWVETGSISCALLCISTCPISRSGCGGSGSYLARLFRSVTSVLTQAPVDIPGYKETVRPFSSGTHEYCVCRYDMPGPSRMPFSLLRPGMEISGSRTRSRQPKSPGYTPKRERCRIFPSLISGPLLYNSASPVL